MKRLILLLSLAVILIGCETLVTTAPLPFVAVDWHDNHHHTVTVTDTVVEVIKDSVIVTIIKKDSIFVYITDTIFKTVWVDTCNFCPDGFMHEHGKHGIHFHCNGHGIHDQGDE